MKIYATSDVKHYLNDLITNLTFGVYIGKFRLEYAQKMLIDPQERKTLIADIAYCSGFNPRGV
ncbi:MAG: hypothetical protein FWH18_02380 [Marinilabiliaceae bacterium]|nr:hypothetical protein [Marinilabiliaceae bacterium]